MAGEDGGGVGRERAAQGVRRDRRNLGCRAAGTQRFQDVVIRPATTWGVAPDRPLLAEADTHAPPPGGGKVIECLDAGTQGVSRSMAQLNLTRLDLPLFVEEQAESAVRHPDAVDAAELPQGVDPGSCLG